MDLAGLLVQAVSGAVGGSAVGSAAKNCSLGPIGNAIAGAVGGGVLGQLIGSVAGPMIEGWIGDILGGGVGGIAMTLICRSHSQHDGKIAAAAAGTAPQQGAVSL
jgi:hypothetical protein